jgi:glutamate 5-kinase
MRSKVVAAEMASAGGVPAVIAHGGTPGVVAAAIAGEAVGTRFGADERAVSSFKLWIRYGRPTAGRIEVDPGARKALERDGGSLLPVGVTGATGRFTTGDAVEIADPAGVVFARGLAEQPAAEVRKRAGQRGGEPAVHRDNLVLLLARTP